MSKRIPSSIPSERMLLAAVMADPVMYDVCDGLVSDADFYDTRHGAIWSACRAIRARRHDIDPTVLMLELGRTGHAGAVGGEEYLLGLCDSIPSASAETFARIVRDAARRRAIIRACQEQAERGYSESIDTAEYIAETEGKIFGACAPDKTLGGPIHAKEGVARFWTSAVANHKAGGLLGVRSGIRALDGLISGFRNSELTVVAARPSMGKSALLETIAINAISQDKRVLYFSAEMSHETLWPRVLAKVTDIDSIAIRDLQLSRDGFDQVRIGIDFLAARGLYVDDDSEITISQLKGRATRHAREHGCDMIVVDYIQYIHPSRKHDRRDLEVGEVSRGLKTLAKELGIPVVAAAQVNRGSALRADKRPTKADLRESGSIENDADVIIFPHREAYYRREEVESGKRQAADDEVFDESQAEIIVDKNRSGKTGTVVCRYDGARCLFVDVDM